MAEPEVYVVDCTSRPLEAILCGWFNSRDPGRPTWTVANFWARLIGTGHAGSEGCDLDPIDVAIFHRLMKEKVTSNTAEDAITLFYDIMKLDIPLLEFVTFNLSFNHVPRSFVDQLDRTRTAAFWEESVRVKDLSTFATREDYFIPKAYQTNPDLLAEYKLDMLAAEQAYRRQISLGARPEQARGSAVMHINVRADMSVSLRTLIQMVRKRACFFAQAEYWEPVINKLVPQVCERLPRPERARQLFNTLPCDLEKNDCKCPYKRDIMDRLVDKSNPICPVLYVRELGEDERDRTVTVMSQLYGRDVFVDTGVRYLKAMRPQISDDFVKDVLTRSVILEREQGQNRSAGASASESAGR